MGGCCGSLRSTRSRWRGFVGNGFRTRWCSSGRRGFVRPMWPARSWSCWRTRVPGSRLPFEQHPNPYITPELNFDFHYFFMRKYWFAYLAKALVVFPGGFGTLDEMFELLTLAQTKKLAKKITVVIYGSEYWKHVVNLE